MAGKNKTITPTDGVIDLHAINGTTPGVDQLQVYNNSASIVYVSGAELQADAKEDYVVLDKRTPVYIYTTDLGAWAWVKTDAQINVQDI